MRAYDPEGIEQAKRLLNGVEFCPDPYLAADGCDALIIVTEWDEFRALDLQRMAQVLNQPLLVDLRNIYPLAEAERAGFGTVGVGRRRLFEREVQLP